MAPNQLYPISHPPRTPVLGNMLAVDGDAPIQDLMRIAHEQGAPRSWPSASWCSTRSRSFRRASCCP